eukprot:scaffold2572_cov75-Skeletonema_marinoi.AAC.23
MLCILHCTCKSKKAQCLILVPLSIRHVSLHSFDSICPTFSRRIERLKRLETIGTKRSNDASLQLRFYSVQKVVPSISIQRVQALSEDTLECLSGALPLKLVAIDVCVYSVAAALEARRIAENLLLLKRDKMVAPAHAVVLGL